MEFRKVLRNHFFKKQQGKCYYCGRELEKYFHLDHKIPKSRGGKFIKENLVASCDFCNMSKGNSTIEEYRERVKNRVIKEFQFYSEKLKEQRFLYLLNSISEKDQNDVCNAYVKLISTIEDVYIVFYGEKNGRLLG